MAAVVARLWSVAMAFAWGIGGAACANQMCSPCPLAASALKLAGSASGGYGSLRVHSVCRIASSKASWPYRAIQAASARSDRLCRHQ